MTRKAKVKKIKRELRKKQLRNISIVSASTFLLFSNSLIAKAETVDDLRELLGETRVDSQYTSAEQLRIQLEWTKIENHNRVARMFELGEMIDLGEETEEQRKVMLNDIEQVRADLLTGFASGKSIDEVLTLKTNLENLKLLESRLKKESQPISMEYIDNVWTEELEKIKAMQAEISSYNDIGVVGSALMSPARNHFYLSSPYGIRFHPIQEQIKMHWGIDLAAPEGIDVLSAWNGVVTRVYESEVGGKTIEVDHGSTLKTRYLHLSDIYVEVGDEVDQYDIIGAVGSTGASTGPHLHFEVHLDGETVNPILLFGENGVKALQYFLSTHQDSYSQENRQLLSQIKDKPEWMEKLNSDPVTKEQEDEVKFKKSGEVPEDSEALIIESGFSAPKPSSVMSDVANPTQLFALKDQEESQ